MKNEVSTKRPGDNERGEEREKHLRKRDRNSEPCRGQAVLGKDTINRRNRMKLRCVRGGEKRRERAGGGESDRESDTRSRRVMQTSLQTSLSTSSDTR